MTATHRHHAVDYIEIAAPNLAEAKEFYAAAFGWEFIDYGPQYSAIRAIGSDGEMGGLNPAGRPGAGGALVLLFSDDLDATAASVVAAGGTITAGPYEFPGGRRFELLDPSGNALGVWAHS